MTMSILLRSCIQDKRRILGNIRLRTSLSISSCCGMPSNSVSKSLDHKTCIRYVFTKSTSACVDGNYQVIERKTPTLPVEIDLILRSWKNNAPGSDAGAFLRERLHECSLNQVCNLMRLLGKKSISKAHLILRAHLPAVASHLETFSSSSWKFDHVSSIIYGLQCMKEEEDGYRRIISLATNITDKSFINSGNPSSLEISKLMIGLQNNKANTEKSRVFLLNLASIVRHSKGGTNSQTIGNALYGLKCMSSDHVEVRSLLSALEPKVQSCKESLSAQAVGNAL